MMLLKSPVYRLQRLTLFRLIIRAIRLKSKKADYDTKIKEIGDKTSDHDKYITTTDFNRFSGTIFDKRLEQANLPATTNINAIEQRAIKNKEKIEKLQKYGQSYFNNVGSQNP